MWFARGRNLILVFTPGRNTGEEGVELVSRLDQTLESLCSALGQVPPAPYTTLPPRRASVLSVCVCVFPVMPLGISVLVRVSSLLPGRMSPLKAVP